MRNKIFIFLLSAFLATKIQAADTITLMVVATPAAITGMGGDAEALQKILTDIENINRSFTNSGIDGFVKLVRLDRFNMVEQGCMYDMLNMILKSDEGEIDRIHQERSIYSADVVCVIVNEPSQCGIAGDYNNSSQAYMLVHYECLGKNFSMARELGYLLGCGNNKSQSGRFNFSNPTAFGYYYENDEDIEGVSFSTIMGYTDETLSSNEDDFNMIPYWSTPDPNIKYRDRNVGDRFHDNAGQIRTGLQVISKYFFDYGRLRLAKQRILPSTVAKVAVKRTLDIEETEIDQQAEADFHAPRTRLTKIVIKKGAKVRIVSTGN